MQDKRLTHRLTDYWNRLRKEYPLPQIGKFNPAALEDIMGKCCIWRVEISSASSTKQIPIYTSEFVGEEVKQAVGLDMGEAFSPHIQNFAAARIIQKIDEVVRTGNVVADEGQFINESHKIVKYRSCLLPFGTPKGKVTNVLLGISWKAF